MDHFEKYINNLNLHNSEPPGDHENRFEEKLLKNYGTRSLSTRSLISIAASIVVLIGLAAAILFSNQKESTLILANETKEYCESEQYFQEQIDERMATIQNLDKKELYADELKSLDDSFSTLKEDLATTPGDPRVVDAVLNTYMLKIEALDNIVNILKKTT